MTCRACAARSGNLVLDLGDQPACDHFPDDGDLGRDARYPLRMWLCGSCGLAQLLGEPTMAEEALGTEPQALVDQAADAVGNLATSGWLADRHGWPSSPVPTAALGCIARGSGAHCGVRAGRPIWSSIPSE